MYTNTSCTLYLAAENYKKVTIPHCFLTHRSIATSVKLGLDYSESAFCMINGRGIAVQMLTPSKSLLPGKNLYPSSKKFCCDSLVFTKGKDFMVEGNCPFLFNNNSEKDYSDSIKALNKLGAFTIMMPDWKGYGSQKMRHWELSCK